MKILFLATWLLLLAATGSPAQMTQLERQRLIAHFEMTESWLSDELAGLTAEQANFRPAPGVWTILENLDHLAVAEPIYWRDFQNAMRAPAMSGRSPASDDSFLWYGIDRTNRGQAIPAELPSGRLADLKTGIESFRKLRAEMLKYIRTTQDDLRSHLVRRENCDAYQWLLLISAHAQRHILQIREVKKNPRFPRR